jgi:hypothetical protein
MSDVGEGIVVQDGRYFAAQWFASGDGWDLLVALWRDPGGPWVAQGRIRRYVDDLVHDSDDEKVWFSAQVRDLDADEPAALASSQALVDFLTHGSGAEVHKLIVRSDRASDVVAAPRREHWAHFGETVTEES